VADWGGGMSASCKLRVQLFINADGRIVHCGIISWCQSAATSEIVKALLATRSSHVRSAIFLHCIGPSSPDWSAEAGPSVSVYNGEHGGGTYRWTSRDEAATW